MLIGVVSGARVRLYGLSELHKGEAAANVCANHVSLRLFFTQEICDAKLHDPAVTPENAAGSDASL